MVNIVLLAIKQITYCNSGDRGGNSGRGGCRPSGGAASGSARSPVVIEGSRNVSIRPDHSVEAD